MLFSGIPFLFYFLPVTLTLYFLAPRQLKNGVLLLSSLFFYGWGEPKYLLLMVGSICAFYGFGLAIGKCRRACWRKFWLILSVISGIALLGVFKYADFFLSAIAAVTGRALPLLELALPVGISFYLFQCISYGIDVYQGTVQPQRNILSFGTYVSLFPQLIAGPIVRYADVAQALENRESRWQDVALGLRRFLVGLGKKVLLANNFGLLTQAFRASEEKSVLFYWMYAIAFTLQIYFDFSGYSDMAIGLGRIFGFRFPENFDYPYLAKSVTEFWRRWHMSLGSWFRDYVYIPLGGNRVSRARWVRNILIVWMLTGLWHGAAWNFILWGLLFAVLLLLEKALPGLRQLPAALAHVYVLLAVVLSFVLFHAESLSQTGSDLLALFGLGNVPLVTPQTLYFLRSYGILFAVGFVGATPMVRKFANRLPKGLAAVLEPLILLALLLLCSAYLVDGSFNPFLYFRF